MLRFYRPGRGTSRFLRKKDTVRRAQGGVCAQKGKKREKKMERIKGLREPGADAEREGVRL